MYNTCSTREMECSCVQYAPFELVSLNEQVKLVDYRKTKVAAFTVEGRELMCLPQAFEHFLKHLVGGLHTVYTKLKRLDITPVVCNVEQVEFNCNFKALRFLQQCHVVQQRFASYVASVLSSLESIDASLLQPKNLIFFTRIAPTQGGWHQCIHERAIFEI